MTSTITVTFNTPRKIDVSIDNIDAINPHMLEMADRKIEHEYNIMEGARRRQIKAEEEAAAAGKAEAEAKAAELASLEKEELAKHKEAAVKAAAERYDKATKAQKKAMETEAKEDAEKARGRDFLRDIGVVAERESA